MFRIYSYHAVFVVCCLLSLLACREKCKPVVKRPALFFIKADTAAHIISAKMVLDNKDTFKIIDGGRVTDDSYSGISKEMSQVLYNELPLSKSRFKVIVQTDKGAVMSIVFHYKVYPVYNSCTDLVDYKIDNTDITDVENTSPFSIEIGFKNSGPLYGFLNNNIFYQSYSDYVGIEIF